MPSMVGRFHFGEDDGGLSDVVRRFLDADIKHTFFKDTQTDGIGRMDEDTWQKTVKTLAEQGAMNQTIDASKAFADKCLARRQAARAVRYQKRRCL